MGVQCAGRTAKLPIPETTATFSYELDVVFSIAAGPTDTLAADEIVGSIKTTSKDRLDKIFLDKFVLSRLLARDVRVVAIFLHDVQRSSRGRNAHGIAATFKPGHFIGYTLVLTRLNGVYYVDPLPTMFSVPELAAEIRRFSQFVASDLWTLLGT